LQRPDEIQNKFIAQLYLKILRLKHLIFPVRFTQRKKACSKNDPSKAKGIFGNMLIFNTTFIFHPEVFTCFFI